jgi:hypothetical protein
MSAMTADASVSAAAPLDQDHIVPAHRRRPEQRQHSWSA